MKIHNPEITGSLIFPRTDGTRVVIKLDSAGSLITDDQNSGGVSTGTKPSADFSGSFTGSFVGDGSNLTGVSATEFNIDALDALGGASVEQGDTFLLSDAGTEKKLTFSNLEDSIFGNISGDVTIAAGGVSSIGTGVIVNTDVNNSAAIASSKINYNGTGIVSGSGQIALSGATGNSDNVSEGSSNLYFTNTRVTNQVNDLGVFSGSSQVTHDSTTGFVADEHIDHTSVSMIAGDGLTGGGDIATSRTFEIASGNNGITVNANDITLNTSSTTFTNGVKSKLNAETVISGSTFSSPSQGTLRATINGSNSDIDLGLQSADDVTFGSIVLNGDISGSSTSTGSFGRVEVNASTLAIGGVEINSTVASNIQTTSGTNTGDVTLGGSYNYLTLDSQVITLGQVDATSDISNLTTANVSEVTNLYYTDTRVKTKLTAENVHSGSAQVVSSLVSSTGISNGNKTSIQNNLGVDAAGTDNSTDVTLANTNYLSLSGQVITGGTVPLGSGGTGATSAGAARTALGVDAAGTDNSTDVTLAGSYNYLSLSGQEITLGQVDYSTDISNTPTTITSGQITKLGHISVTQAVNLDTMESNIATNNNKVGYTDALVKTKLNAETVISGSSQVNAQSATNPSAIYDNSGTPTLRSGITQAELQSAIGVDSSGTDNSTDVTLAGSYDYISISGQVITRGQVDASTDISNLTTTNVSEGTNKYASTANVKSALNANLGTLTLGDSDDTVTIPGNLTVTGTTTTNNVETVSTSNGVIFEGNVADANEVTLLAGTVTADRTITLPDATGTVALTSDIPTNNNELTNGAGYITSFDITTQTDSKYLRSNATDTASGVITFSNSTASTSKTTGAVIVTGGVGIGGDLNVGGDVVAYASSDERLKDNIELISNPIEKVQSLKGVTWNWNDDASETQKSTPNVGVIAQDVEKVLPQLVHDRDNGFKGVDYSKLTGLLIEAIKDQQKQIDELKSKLS